MEALLLAQAKRRREEENAAVAAGQLDYGTTFFMYAGYRHYHRPSTLNIAVKLVRDQPPFEAIVFPCCGYAITETLVLEAVNPAAKAIFMDRHVDRRVRRRSQDVEVKTFDDLATVMTELDAPTLVVGINAMVSDHKMRQDPGFPGFVKACLTNRHVHRDIVLTWIGHHFFDYAQSAVVPLADLETFDCERDERVRHSGDGTELLPA